MIQLIIKFSLTAGLVVAIAEVAKRSTFIGGLLASLPLVSILAFFWLYCETKDTEQIAQLSISIFWLVIPSLILFVVLPLLLRKGLGFYESMGLAAAATILGYYLMAYCLSIFKVKL